MPSYDDLNWLSQQVAADTSAASQQAKQSVSNNSPDDLAAFEAAIQGELAKPTKEQESGITKEKVIEQALKNPAISMLTGSFLSDANETLAEAGVVGAARTVGNIASLPFSAQATKLGSFSDEQLEAYNNIQKYSEFQGLTRDNYKQKIAERIDRTLRSKANPYSEEELIEMGKAQVEDFEANLKILDQVEEKEPAGTTPYGSAPQQDFSQYQVNQPENVETKIKRAVDASKTAKDITDIFDISGVMDQTNRDALNQDLTFAFNTISEAWKNDDVSMLSKAATAIGETVSAVANNKLAIGEYVAENLPSIALGGAGRVGALLQTADHTGYAAGIFNDAIADYQEKNNGELPSQGDMGKMMAFAASAGLAEKVGDASLLKALTKPGKSVNSFLGKAAVGTAKVGKEIVTEGVTEGYQTAVEENLSKLDYDLAKNAEQIYKAAVIGGASGGAIGGAGAIGRGISPTLQVAGEAITSAREAIGEATKRKAVKSAEAVQAKFDAKFNKTEDAPKAINETATEALEAISDDDMDYEEKVAITHKMQSILDQHKEDHIGATAEFTDALAEIDDPEQIAELEKKQEQAAADYEAAKVAMDRMNQLISMKPADIKKGLEDIKLGDTSAAKRIFGSFKANPDSLTAEQAIELADSGSVSKEQAKTLRTFAELKNTFEGTSKEIYEGGYNDKLGTYMRGIKDYQDMYVKGNRKEALDGLLNFANVHTAKATNLRHAWNKFQETGADQQVDNLVVNKKSAKLIRKIDQEAQDLKAAYQVMKRGGTNVRPTEIDQDQKVSESGTTDTQVETTPTTGTGQSTEQVKATKAQEFVEASRERVPTEPRVTKVGKTFYTTKEDGSIVNSKTGKPARPDIANKVVETQKEIDALTTEPTISTETETEVQPEQEVTKREVPETDTRTDAQKDLELKVIHRAQRDYRSKNTPMATAIRNQLQNIQIEFLKGTPLVNLLAQETDDITLLEAIDQIESVLTNNKIDLNTHRTTEVTSEQTQETETVVESTGDTVRPTKQFSGLAKDILSKGGVFAEKFKLGKNPSALDSIEDFVNAYRTDPSILDEYNLASSEPAIMFARLNLAVSNSLEEIFRKPGTKGAVPEHLYDQDMIRYLLNDDGSIPENVKTALTVGIYNWITSEAKGTLLNTHDDIRSLFGLDDEAKISPALYNMISKAGTTANAVKNDIGSSALSALNFKPTDTALLSDKSRFENSFGNLGLGVLANLGLVEVSSKSNQAILAALPEGTERVSEGDTTFVKAIGSENTLSPRLQRLIDTNKKDTKFTQKVFGTQVSRPMPSFTPNKAPTNIRKSTQKVSAKAKAVIQKHMDKEHYFNAPVMENFYKLSEMTQKLINGFTPEEEINKVMKHKRDGLKSANDAIARDLEVMEEFYAEAYINGLENPHFYDHEQWVNLRLGMSNQFNLQSSKVHRFTVYQPEWSKEIEPSNKEQMDDFLLAIGESLDIVADKSHESDALADTKKKLEDPAIRNAIDQLKNLLTNKEVDEEVLAKGIKAGKAKMHTYVGLLTYAQYELAGGSKFTSHLFREVDGVTNAAGFTALQFPDVSKKSREDKLNRTGMFKEDMTYADYRARPGTLDSYESIADVWETYLQGAVDNPDLAKEIKAKYSATDLSAANYILGSFRETILKEVDGEQQEITKITKDGRNAAKPTLMTTIYGAGFGGVLDKFTDVIIDTLYNKLEKAINEGNQDEINSLVNATNYLIGSNVINANNVNLEFSLNKQAEKVLKKKLGMVYGPSLKVALDSEFSELFGARDTINKVTQLSYQMFNQLYDKRVAERLAETGALELTIAEHREIEQSLKKAMPIVGSAFSSNIDEGMVLLKSDLTPQNREATGKTDNNNPYYAKSDFAKPIEGLGKSTSTYGSKRVYKDPGVMALPMMVQSMDSATMFRSMWQSNVLNVFDAIGVGADNFERDTQIINKAFLDVNQENNLMEFISVMGNRVLGEFEANGGDFSTLSMKVEGKETTGLDPDTIRQEIEQSVFDAQMYEDRKQEELNELVVINQYNDGARTAFKPNAKRVLQEENAIKGTIDSIKETGTKPLTNGQLSKGSSYEQTLDNYEFEPAVQIDKLSTTSTYHALQDSSLVQDSPEHKVQLENVLSKLVNRVITPFNLRMDTRTDGTSFGVIQNDDIYLVNQINQPNSPSKTLGGYMSNGEVFVHELVHSVTQLGLENNLFAKAEVVKLWTQAKKVIKPEHFLPEGVTEGDSMYEQEMEIAKNKWDHIFTIRKDAVVNGKIVSNHLHEFVAFGLTNDKFRQQLVKIPYKATKRKSDNNNAFLNKLENVFNKLLDYVVSTLYGTRGKTADKQLDQLALALANIDVGNKAKLKAAYNEAMKPVMVVRGGVREFTDKIDPQIQQLKHYTKVASEPMFFVTQTLLKNAHREFSKSENVLATGMVNLVQEARGRYNQVAKFHDLKRLGNALIDQARDKMRVITTTSLEQAFTRQLTDKEQRALTFALGKTDSTVIMDMLGEEMFGKVFTSKAELGIAIARVKEELKEFPDYQHYISQAESLGRFMVTGEVGVENQMLNADNIAKLYGTGKDVPIWVEDTIPHIDLLASLYAVQYLDTRTKDSIKSLMDTEYEGIKYSTKMLKAYRDRSSKEFSKNKVHMIKGYMHDITNPDIGIKIGTAADIDRMARDGYSIEMELTKDPDDPTSRKRYIYKNMHGGHRGYLAGITYLQTNTAKGTKLENMMVNPQEGIEPEELPQVGQDLLDKKQSKTRNQKFNPKRKSALVPILNSAGKVVDYRYMMKEAQKDSLLDRKPNFFNLLGVMEGNLVAKANIPEQNSKVLAALHEQYKEDYDKNASLYVTISGNSTEPRLREIYRQLPLEMRKELHDKFGGVMPVRKDQLNLLFGYRKYSITEMFYKDKAARTAVGKVLHETMTKVFGNKKITQRIFTAENLVQELVKATKDIIVVKSGVVTLANTMSNIAQLWVSGVDIADIGSDYAQAWEGLRVYKQDQKELGLLKNDLDYKDLTVSERIKMEQRVLELESNLATNPIGELVDEGVLSNIVEDLSVKREDFSLKGGAIAKITGTSTYNKVVSNIPNPIQSLASEALVMQGSTMYDLMSFGAQFSDFGARYVLYKHYTQKKGMEPKDAVGRVMDDFINYDLPTGKYLQYMNDIGLLWFSKYLVRVQKVIFRLFKENPARALSFIAVNNLLGAGIPNIMESSVLATSPLSRFDDPFSMAMSASDDLVTAKMAGSLF